MAIGYTKNVWVNGGAPALNAANLGHVEDGVKACADALDLETTAGKAITQAANAAAQRALLNVEDGADVTDEANVTAAAVGTAEITTAPNHIWALVAGALKLLTWDGAKALLATAFKHGGSNEIATATPGANVIPKAGADSKLAAGFIPFAADGGTTAGTAVQGNDARLTSAPATWTPAPYLGLDADDGTYTISENYYTKNGKFCHAEFRIVWTAKGTKTGALSFIYTPLASRSTQSMPVGQAVVFAGGVSITATPIVVISGSRIYVHLQGAAATTAITNSNLSNTTDLKIVMDYIAA